MLGEAFICRAIDVLYHPFGSDVKPAVTGKVIIIFGGKDPTTVAFSASLQTGVSKQLEDFSPLSRALPPP